MDWIQALVLLHVLSAIIGVGPTFFAHVLLRGNQSIGELRVSLRYAKLLEYFPKIGGSLAVLTGILLVVVTGYTFSELWIIVSIALYVAIQIVVVAFITPLSKKLNDWIASAKEDDRSAIPSAQATLLSKTNRIMYVAASLGVLLFAMMFLRPIL